MGSCFSRPRRPPTPAPLPDEGDLPVEDCHELIAKVFQNDLLLDLILTNVLLNPATDRKWNGTFSHYYARILRLVCRRWMLTVSCLFLQVRQPVLRLKSSNFRRKRLRSLVKGFGRSSLYATPFLRRRHSSLPPFSLYLEEANWWRRYLFKTLMVRFDGASSLVQLRVRDWFFFNSIILPTLPPNMKFTKLHKVTIEYSDTQFIDAKYVARFNAFTQDILDRATDLRDVTQENSNGCCFSYSPVHIIPQTVTHFQTETVTAHVAKQIATSPLLMQLPLLQLKSLTVGINKLEDGDLRKFLIGVRQSLEHLSLKYTYGPETIQMDMETMPVFPKLRSLELRGRIMLLLDQTGNCEELKCPSVQSLRMPLADRKGRWNTPVSLGTMFRIRLNFPQVAHMNVKITGTCIAGLENLFVVMGGHLKTLTIRYDDEFNDFSSTLQLSQDEWEAVFLGTTPEIVEHYKHHPDLLREIVNRKECVQRSIRNLGNLEQFTISVTGWHFAWASKAKIRLELTFWLGFMGMPGLKHLRMGECFGVSQEAMQLWRQTSGQTFNNNYRM